ncbi:MAG: bacillithiol biosynthesis cysteine-adding enzyme BshC [Terracidiphilus sp.]
MSALLTTDCYPITVAPGLSRLFLDYCAGDAKALAFFGSTAADTNWQLRPPVPAHWPELVRLLQAQNTGPSPAASAALDALSRGVGVVVTGQQVGLFGGPLFTPFKAATALARARTVTASGHPHVAIFWLASEDHDFAEINHVTFPGRKELHKLVYASAPASPPGPVGGIVLDDSITELIDQAWELLGPTEAMEFLAAAYRPGRTFAQAFAEFYSKIFATQGLLVLDASGREAHSMGAPVLRAGLELADELHAALLDRNRELEAAGYHTQVAVGAQNSLLFLIDEKTGARQALRRTAPSATEPAGLWQAGRQSYTTADLVGILDGEPERISPSALLRPVFQDFLLSTSLTIGGPAEIAYFAQNAVLFDRILGRMAPVQPRFSGTLIEPAIADLLRQHELTLERVFEIAGQESGAGAAAALTQLLAARAMPIETKQKLAAAGTALDAELTTLLDWMRAQNEGLGKSAETAASKMLYQMNRMRTLAANYQLQREASLGRHAEAICRAVDPDGGLQERLHGAAYYFARYGFELAEELTAQAANPCPGHTALWL